MSEDANSLAERYVRLAFALEYHIPDNIDAYYGPPEWKVEEETKGKAEIGELAAEAASLDAAITSADMDEQRRDYLQRQVRAIQTCIRRVQGEDITLTTEVASVFDVQPTWTDEAIFEEGHRVLDKLLTGEGPLAQRLAERKKRVTVPVSRLQELIPDLFDELRRRTRERFPLPAEEGVELEWQKDKPWSAYNWYLGNRRSLIEINTDKPQEITSIVMLLAHEAYPGHHTEHALKETRLVRGEGRVEHSIALLNSPACTVAEGIATIATSVVLGKEEWIRWHHDTIFPRAGCAHLDAEQEYAIDDAREMLKGVRGNAAFMLHDQGASHDEVAAYLEHWQLASPEDARRGVRFINMPVSRAYTFTYTEGEDLLNQLFAKHGNRDQWFERLLTEAVTPEQVRQWIRS